MNTLPKDDLGYSLMAAAFEVHNILGGGLLEEIYQESLTLELTLQKIQFLEKPQLDITYKGHKLNKQYIPDLIIANTIIVELKAVAKLLPEHQAQIINYMRISDKKTGYLLNFAPIAQLEWKRLVL